VETVVCVEGLRKRYGENIALDGIDFKVRKGEVFGLLGPNGAGKTTTLECVEGLRGFESGTVQVAGFDVKAETKIRGLLGVQLQTSSLPDEMSAKEAMELVCAWHGLGFRHDLLQKFGIDQKKKILYSQMSTGQKRRLHLALSLATNPSVVVLDEPTAGLDVEGRNQFHAAIRELQANGVTFLLATHDMAEAEMLCDRIAILLRGKIVIVGTPSEITAAGNRETKITIQTQKKSLFGKRVEHSRFLNETSGAGVWLSRHVKQGVTELLQMAEEAEDDIIDLRVERPSLEERFLEIIEAEG